VAEAAAGFDFPLVVDPVMVTKHGAPLMDQAARQAVRRLLVPRAFLLTPNLAEAEALTGLEVSTPAGMRAAAEHLVQAGAKAVLVKGGHLDGDPLDILLFEGQWREFPAPRLQTKHTHGTGCAYSAAIAAGLAKGVPLVAAVEAAKRFVTEAICTNPGLGRGSGPINLHVGKKL
jgi:hydroxymethylpyrimidine kinase/phosphomethylpyrimidine kinase